MSVYFCSDPHLGHRNIAKFRDFVSSPEDNTRQFVTEWEQTINKNDVIYCLGDMAFDYESLGVLRELKGRKILISGNHDDYVSLYDKTRVFEEIHGMLKYKGLWLTHCPIHPEEMRKCAANLHGHTHYHIIKKGWGPFKKEDPRYINCCVDVIYPRYGTRFLSLDEAKRRAGL